MIWSTVSTHTFQAGFPHTHFRSVSTHISKQFQHTHCKTVVHISMIRNRKLTKKLYTYKKKQNASRTGRWHWQGNGQIKFCINFKLNSIEFQIFVFFSPKKRFFKKNHVYSKQVMRRMGKLLKTSSTKQLYTIFVLICVLAFLMFLVFFVWHCFEINFLFSIHIFLIVNSM